MESPAYWTCASCQARNIQQIRFCIGCDAPHSTGAASSSPYLSPSNDMYRAPAPTTTGGQVSPLVDHRAPSRDLISPPLNLVSFRDQPLSSRLQAAAQPSSSSAARLFVDAGLMPVSSPRLVSPKRNYSSTSPVRLGQSPAGSTPPAVGQTLTPDAKTLQIRLQTEEILKKQLCERQASELQLRDRNLATQRDQIESLSVERDRLLLDKMKQQRSSTSPGQSATSKDREIIDLQQTVRDLKTRHDDALATVGKLTEELEECKSKLEAQIRNTQDTLGAKTEVEKQETRATLLRDEHGEAEAMITQELEDQLRRERERSRGLQEELDTLQAKRQVEADDHHKMIADLKVEKVSLQLGEETRACRVKEKAEAEKQEWEKERTTLIAQCGEAAKGRTEEEEKLRAEQERSQGLQTRLVQLGNHLAVGRKMIDDLKADKVSLQSKVDLLKIASSTMPVQKRESEANPEQQVRVTELETQVQGLEFENAEFRKQLQRAQKALKDRDSDLEEANDNLKEAERLLSHEKAYSEETEKECNKQEEKVKEQGRVLGAQIDDLTQQVQVMTEQTKILGEGADAAHLSMEEMQESLADALAATAVAQKEATEAKEEVQQLKRIAKTEDCERRQVQQEERGESQKREDAAKAERKQLQAQPAAQMPPPSEATQERTPQSGATTAHRAPQWSAAFYEGAVAFYEKNKLDSVDKALGDFASRSLESEAALGRSDETPRGEATDHRARLVAFYEKHNPDKLDSVDRTLENYAGREEKMFEILGQKYGAEPSGSVGSPSAPATKSAKKTKVRGLDRLKKLGYSQDDIGTMKAKHFAGSPLNQQTATDLPPKWPNQKDHAQQRVDVFAVQRERDGEHTSLEREATAEETTAALGRTAETAQSGANRTPQWSVAFYEGAVAFYEKNKLDSLDKALEAFAGRSLESEATDHRTPQWSVAFYEEAVAFYEENKLDSVDKALEAFAGRSLESEATYHRTPQWSVAFYEGAVAFYEKNKLDSVDKALGDFEEKMYEMLVRKEHGAGS